MTCHCDDLYGPIVLGGPCRKCGYPHFGQTCEEHEAEVDATIERIVKAIRLTLESAPVSYSFSVQAATKDEAEIKIRDELAKVVSSQPAHAVDSDQAFEAAAAFLRLLPDETDRDVFVSVNGSIWKSDAGVQSASVSVSASMQARKAA